MLSRLKGIETDGLFYNTHINPRTLDMLSRLKGIETCGGRQNDQLL